MDSRESVLNSIKKLHGISEDDTSFDTDLIIHINSTLMALNQIGLGPVEGFFIEDSTTTWLEFVENRFIAEAVASYVYVKVRLVFDPPASPTVVDALRSSAKENEWRIAEWVEQNG